MIYYWKEGKIYSASLYISEGLNMIIDRLSCEKWTIDNFEKYLFQRGDRKDEEKR